MGLFDLIFNFWLIGFIAVYFLLTIDYISLNLQRGCSIFETFISTFSIDTIICFAIISLGSWLTLFMLMCDPNDIKN